MKFDPSIIGVFGTPINRVHQLEPYFIIEEQPGDGTKYVHRIKMDREKGTFTVMAWDRNRGAATLMFNKVINLEDVLELRDKIKDTKVDDDVYIVRDLINDRHLSFVNENLYTIASAFRCIIYIYETYCIKEGIL